MLFRFLGCSSLPKEEQGVSVFYFCLCLLMGIVAGAVLPIVVTAAMIAPSPVVIGMPAVAITVVALVFGKALKDDTARFGWTYVCTCVKGLLIAASLTAVIVYGLPYVGRIS